MNPAAPCFYFNPRSPRGGATRAERIDVKRYLISIHAPHEGERQLDRHRKGCVRSHIQSTLPTRGSDSRFCHYREISYGYSIHAPHDGGATIGCFGAGCDRNLLFNPRSPRGGATVTVLYFVISTTIFNPRSPRGGATALTNNNRQHLGYSIHAPHEGERLSNKPINDRVIIIQSTLPTRGSDAEIAACFKPPTVFNPRSPRGGATFSLPMVSFTQRMYSIHAPHEGERPIKPCSRAACSPYSIHAPHEGERHVWQAREKDGALVYSIHAPHEGERLLR